MSQDKLAKPTPKTRRPLIQHNMNGKKTDRELIEDMWGILFGNPNHQCGLISEMGKMKLAVKNNTRISWAVLLVIIAGTLGLIIS